MLELDAEHRDFGRSFAGVLSALDGGDVLVAAGAHGMLGMQVAEEYGGGGIDDPRFVAVALSELAGEGRIGEATSYAAHAGLALPFLQRCAPDQLRAALLPDLVEGARIATVVLGDVTATTDDGQFLSGTVTGVVNGATARLLVVAYSGDRGPAVAFVAADHPGISRTVEDAVALAGSRSATVSFDRVPVDSGLTVAGEAAAQLLAEHRLWNAWIAVRATATVLEWTLEYVRARHVFGTSVASFENTRLVLAGVEADRRVAAAAVESLVAGLVSGGLDLDGAAAASHVAVEMFVRAADQGLQLHGGYGYMREYPISTAFADANLLQLRADATGPLDVLAGALGLDPDEVSGGRSRESA